MVKARTLIAAVTWLLTLAACGGSSGGATPPPPPPPPPPITTAEAFQFLNQSTFGATQDDAQDVVNLRFEAW
ncbi:MAG: DUF1800 domain-containing protein, partial [Gammaproteobacteria bacterium]|nr:DUF1800 domain-containing protein [Gammaproteobacteria bacterium]